MAAPLFITKYKKQIDDYIENFLTNSSNLYVQHPQSKTLFPYLITFCKNGKSIRGTLFLEFLHLSGKSKQELNSFIPAAAAIELIHGGLLIQDDWMDQDNYRRGQIALHSLLNEEAISANYSLSKKYSAEATNCATDIIFFLGFELLNQIKSPKFNPVREFIMQEYIHVGLAQWQDVLFSYEKSYELTDIDRIYRYKTARYTFVMPIIAALLTVGKKGGILKKIESIAENLGMIFQITDDRLNIFGSQIKTKKTTGSDISDDKKTYYHYYFHKLLIDHLNNSELENIKKYFGKEKITENELEELKRVFINYKIQEKITVLLDAYTDTCRNQIDTLRDRHIRNHFNEMLTFLLERES